jgi:S-adenosylmethionine decarboxylase
VSGVEWVVDARGCDPAALADLGRLQRLFARLIADLNLHPVRDTVWHQFAGAGGITGLCLLAESHLTCHTFPEYGSLCLNLFCCRPRPDWPFVALLKREFAAAEVEVRQLERAYDHEPARSQLSQLRSAGAVSVV